MLASTQHIRVFADFYACLTKINITQYISPTKNNGRGYYPLPTESLLLYRVRSIVVWTSARILGVD
ncbi:MAG: hypothetical protein ACRC62_09810 [Microcoleus sp.]